MQTASHALATVYRFHALHEALGVSRRDPVDQAWLALGAVAALPSRCAPEEAASQLLDQAITLASADGGTQLHSPIRFQVAGTLVEQQADAAAAGVQFRRVRDHLRAAGVQEDAALLAACIEIMLLRGRERLRIPDVTRVALLWRQLQHQRWFLRRRADAPVAALLAARPGRIQDLAALVESCERVLMEATGTAGPAVHAAAGVIAGGPVPEAVALQRVASGFRAAGSEPRPALVAILALHSALPLPPCVVRERAEAIEGALVDMVGGLDDLTRELVGGMLTWLSLAPSGVDGEIGDEDLRAFHAACALIGTDLLPH